MGPAPCRHGNLLESPPIMNGDSPIYFGSAIFDKSVHPGKVEPKCEGSPCSVVLDGDIIYHSGRYDLLPFDPDTMDLVCTSEGRIPAGRRPVKGGYEADGMPLYHGIVTMLIIPSIEYQERQAPARMCVHFLRCAPCYKS
ncbi:hypothetical protein IW261DRAFT_552796 [Armillaria novae-zelandiae]|uniref:Uncharacterized protein n=1 Tax=Armillaria novae-zelandiae TaxID=153914 RepID=A0AA39NZ32_9AGAR|nr:hypothetical protein IW261DRAFT_552796 [Armillaria novae-zelandiae]